MPAGLWLCDPLVGDQGWPLGPWCPSLRPVGQRLNQAIGTQNLTLPRSCWVTLGISPSSLGVRFFIFVTALPVLSLWDSNPGKHWDIHLTAVKSKPDFWLSFHSKWKAIFSFFTFSLEHSCFTVLAGFCCVVKWIRSTCTRIPLSSGLLPTGHRRVLRGVPCALQ